MGVDAGFDMVSRLFDDISNRHDWDCFIADIEEHYKDDEQVERQPTCIVFKTGEHPRLPFECRKFLRFSSNVSGGIAADTGVKDYIDTVTRIARTYFGRRVRFWHEGADQRGHYDWREVNESLRSYGQPGECGTETSIAHSPSRTDPTGDLGAPLFKILNIRGKGNGLVAKFNIPQGTRIFCEKPLLTVTKLPPNELDELERAVAARLRALPRSQQQQFLSLHNKYPRGKHPFGGIVKTNALPCGSNSRVGGVYATVCLINHSCIPNSHSNWNSDAECETVHAIRPIESGEEITIWYDQRPPSVERQAFLKKAFGFQCICSRCSASQASDARRALIDILDNRIGNSCRMANNPEDDPRDCHGLLGVLNEEYEGYAGAAIARLYYDAFQISISYGDQARAGIFAERAYSARVICEGEDSPATRKMKSFALRPADHGSFGLYSMWNTTKETAPRDLDAELFEKWLFMERS